MEKLSAFKGIGEINNIILNTNSHTKKLVLDLDGTLFNHKLFVYERLLFALNQKYYELITPNITNILFNEISERGTNSILDFMCKKQNLDIDKSYFLEILRSDKIEIKENYFRPNLREVIVQLRDTFALSVCTNGNKQQQLNKINKLYSVVGFKIETFYCIEYESKPSPSCIFAAITGDLSSQCTLIGDTIEDLIAANTAKITFLDVVNLVEK